MRISKYNRMFEKSKRIEYEKEKIDRELKEEYGIEEDSQKRKKMFQYSKVLTTIILFFTIIVNGYYYIYLVPQSGILAITDAAMENAATIMKVWDGGTIIFFCSYFAKSLFETKFQKEQEAMDMSQYMENEMGENMDDMN